MILKSWTKNEPCANYNTPHTTIPQKRKNLEAANNFGRASKITGGGTEQNDVENVAAWNIQRIVMLERILEKLR